MVGCLHLSANVRSQTVTLRMQHQPLTTIFERIEQQTGYHVVYNERFVKSTKPISIQAVQMPLDVFLEKILTPQALSFQIKERTVFIQRLKDMETPAMSVPIFQQRTVAGRVTDESGAPLEGVTVRLKGTDELTVTNANGEYRMNVRDDADMIVFSIIGRESLEAKVGTQSTISVSLKEVISDLDEVIVVGYGTVRKSDLTGSVSQVKGEDINAAPYANVLQSLSGRAPGIHIRQSSGAPGPGMSVRIRGGNSIQGSNEPLYVIDGFPITGSNPTQLNNSDIESIEILKDASATAIYGSRGANGVVLITTKKGKSGTAIVDFETSYSSQQLIKKLELMNAREYAEFYNLQHQNDNLTPPFNQSEIAEFGNGFDWQDFIFRSAPMYTTSLNVQAGTDKTQFAVGGSIFGQDGIIQGSDYKRYSVQASVSHRINDKFRIEFSSNLSRLITNRKDSGGGNRGNSMIAAALTAPPILTPYNDDGSYRILHTSYPFLATDLRNPINFINEQGSQIKANLALLNASFFYHITPELFLKISGGFENRDERSDNYTTTKFYNSMGSASIYAGQFRSALNENTLNFDKRFGEKHHVSAVGGFTYQDFVNTSVSASGTGFLSDNFETGNLEAAETPGVPSSGYTKSVLLSFLGRVNYNYDDRYLATASIRRDGSSRYSSEEQWGYFPSAALAWRISNEQFFQNQDVISEFKLRGSWGLTGSQAIDPYTTLNQLYAGRTIFNNDYANTFAPGTRLPGNLKWETTEQIDIGLDVGILKNRILLSADYYVKNTRDLLSNVALPSSMGYTHTIQNVGKIRNSGLEIALDANALEGKFSWDINANIAFNENKVISLYDGEEILRDNINMVVVNDVTSILREGQPVGRFWGYLEEGYDASGNIIFKDVNQDGVISDADKTYIGNPNPKFIYGFNSTMNYQNFELNIFIQGTYGNDIFNASAINNTMDYGFGLNMPRSVYQNHWTPETLSPQFPRISRSTPVRVSDRFVEDGSYLRLKNIMLSYSLPVDRLGITWARQLQIYCSGQNLLTFTNYSWWDPETNFRLDHNSYPSARSITVGLRTRF